MGHWSSVLAVAAAAAGACDAHGTEVRVYFDVQGELPAQARSLAIRVHDHEGVMQSPSPFALADLTLPAWLRVTPRGDDATRRYEVIGELLGPDDVPIARQRAISRYVAGELREIRLVFDTSCNDILCDDGLSCFEGACTDACVEPTLPGEVPRSVFVGCSPPPAGCDPAGYPTCAADALLTCVDGMERRTPCGLGCALGAPACVEPVTSNVPQIGFDEGTANVVVPRGETWVLDTDTRSRATSASRRCEKPCAASAGPRSSTPIRARGARIGCGVRPGGFTGRAGGEHVRLSSGAGEGSRTSGRSVRVPGRRDGRVRRAQPPRLRGHRLHPRWVSSRARSRCRSPVKILGRGEIASTSKAIARFCSSSSRVGCRFA